MQIRFSQSGDRLVVSVEARLDAVSAPEFEKQLLRCIDESQTRLVIDLSRLEYISSAGLRSLMVAAKTASASGGGLCCCGLDGLVKQVFDVSGFSKLFPVFNSVEAALERW